MADGEGSMEQADVQRLKAALYDAAVEIGETQAKVNVLMGIIKGLAEGTIDPGNVEVNEDATSLTLKDASLVPAPKEG